MIYESKVLKLIDKMFTNYIFLRMEKDSFQINSSIDKRNLKRLLKPLILETAKALKVEPLNLMQQINFRKPYRVQQGSM